MGFHHGGASNIVYMDGHASNGDAETIFDDPDDIAWKPWN